LIGIEVNSHERMLWAIGLTDVGSGAAAELGEKDFVH
jgi:hypothetical protein